MLILPATIAEVKPAELAEVPALVVAADDNFDIPADSPLWDEWAAEAAVVNAMSDGLYPF